MGTTLQVKPLAEWIDLGNEPLIISGPCSAENRDQVLITGRELAKIPQVKMFRAGIWKPRTRPGIFEGVGEIGLEWMLELKKETSIPYCVEVATAEHIELALKYQADALWIGARTTGNPFSVQILADALVGVDLPVFVKNPIHPDISLWIGALERINHAGISRLVAIHRGFYSYDNKPYRNLPMWEIPIELKRLVPELPIFCDPSHISGKRELLAEVAQRALDLNMDGLMLESHFNPAIALTDAEQQLSPAALDLMVKKLIVRREHGNIEFQNQLEQLRFEIDQIDHELIAILGRRNDKSTQIGKYKKANNITVLQIERLREMIIERVRYAEKYGIDSAYILKLLQLVHKESVRIQTNLMQNAQE